jgi:alkanesulfonate monooxygenase SsuD/methylene tetrahydromethanopterin reductase-like flavin-dependent oxidoreductase (luciferase family)
MLTVDGKFWKVPAGPTPWTLDTTQKWGKGVENGILKSVGVVPKPLQKPHPPLFQPFASSENTVRFCAQENVTPILPPMLPVFEEKLYSVYSEVSGKKKGEGVGVLRDVIICDTDEEARALWQDSGQFTGRAWFEPFGFRKGVTDPKTGKMLTPDEIVEMGYACVGTVDTVLRGMEVQQKRQPVDWVFAYTYNSLVPHPKLMKSIEAFWTKVMPRFR